MRSGTDGTPTRSEAALIGPSGHPAKMKAKSALPGTKGNLGGSSEPSCSASRPSPRPNESPPMR
eukprot:3819946-Alexandrium_andersonii.AAC.1